MGPPACLGVSCIEIFRWRNITTGLVTFHLTQDASHVVLRMAQMHQLPLVGGFKNAVAHLLTMGEEAESPLALG